MMTEQAKVPAIRFAGFTDPWEQRKLGDCFEFLKSNTLSRAGLNGENGTARNVHYGDILIKFGDCLDDERSDLPFITDDTVLPKYAGSILREGDVIFADTAEDETAGKCVELRKLPKEPTISGLHTIPARPRFPFGTGYLGHYLNSDAYHRQLLPLMQGIKVISVSKAALQDTQVRFPGLSEQSAIGAALNEIDSLITLHQRKYDKLVVFKKTMLEKMFPKDGESVPEIRFAGFTDPWEQRKFSDVAMIKRGLTYSPTDIVDGAGGIRVLRSSNINEDQFVLNNDDVFVNEGAVTIDLVHDGDILITAANGSPRLVGKRARISDLPGKTVQGGFMLVALSPCSDFLCASMGSSWYRRFLATGVAGGNGAIGNLDSKALGETTIAVPNDAEKDKIGCFFTRLDSLITLHQRKLELLQNIKKSLLDKMFV
ncbi:restriction endonuclease subunit S [Bifidobacterium bifidum]|nr:restriction endonuclease subunit S [Bifidobacterium bifidum]MCC8306233.1 restriction endonuclease subunit S [Bifidobacterium bifidum]MCG2834484.1 restriction endonuclease subunit S [Bifidobacterium bifidum]